MNFCHLLAVNLGNDNLVRFQKSVMVNVIGESLDSHHNLQLVLFLFYKLFGLITIKYVNYDCPNASISDHKSLFNQETDH